MTDEAVARAAKGRTVLITGASSGVGLELTRRLLDEGTRVVTLTRSPLPSDEACEAARARGQLRSYAADLSHAESLGAALGSISEDYAALDVIVSVAGVSLGAPEIAPQGREVHFEVNTVAPWVVLQRLQPLLVRGEDKLVINVSSNAALAIRSFDPAQLARPKTFEKLLGPYAASKLALSLWSSAVAPRLAQQGIHIVSVCPGANKTPMTAGPGMPFWLMPLRHLTFSHPRKGAARVWEAASRARSFASGTFLVKGRATPIPFRERADDVLALVEAAAGS